MQFTSPHSNRTVGLQERQAEMLREKIKSLEQRIMEMIRHGSENVMLSDKVLRWARSLLTATDLLALPAAIEHDIQTQFSVPQVGMRLWAWPPICGPDGGAGSQRRRARVCSSLMEPFCGLNTGFEAVGWLQDPTSVSSLALIPLRGGSSADGTNPAFGMLVLASPMRTASTAAWAPTSWHAWVNWPAPALSRLK